MATLEANAVASLERYQRLVQVFEKYLGRPLTTLECQALRDRVMP